MAVLDDFRELRYEMRDHAMPMPELTYHYLTGKPCTARDPERPNDCSPKGQG